MPYKAKQLHLLIMRGLAQDSRDFHGKTAQQHFSMPVAPAWGKGFRMVPSGNTCGTIGTSCPGGSDRKLSCFAQASLWMLSFCCLCFIQPQ